MVSHPETVVSFLPHRLNRQPVVVRGLTADELWICAGLSAASGLAGAGIVWPAPAGPFPTGGVVPSCSLSKGILSVSYTVYGLVKPRAGPGRIKA